MLWMQERTVVPEDRLLLWHTLDGTFEAAESKNVDEVAIAGVMNKCG